jgi:hypothetical protein
MVTDLTDRVNWRREDEHDALIAALEASKSSLTTSTTNTRAVAAMSVIRGLKRALNDNGGYRYKVRPGSMMLPMVSRELTRESKSPELAVDHLIVGGGRAPSSVTCEAPLSS